MHLGAIIARLEDEADAAAAIEALGDLVLYAQVERVAALYGESPGAYLAGAVRRFADGAGHDNWLALMDAMGRQEDPSRAAMSVMLRWALDADTREAPQSAAHAGCSCGGHGSCAG